jgi:hypothetical protein
MWTDPGGTWPSTAAGALNDGILCLETFGRWPYGPAEAVAAAGDYAYVGSGLALLVVDVSDPAAPQRLAEGLCVGPGGRGRSARRLIGGFGQLSSGWLPVMRSTAFWAAAPA